jgi:hypothetical protein
MEQAARRDMKPRFYSSMTTSKCMISEAWKITSRDESIS